MDEIKGVHKSMKIRSSRIQTSLSKKVIVLLCVFLVVMPVVSATAATKRVYEYNENGRLTTVYTATQKITYSYDKNGNLFRKQVEQGDYSSIVNPATPVPEPTAPAPEPIPVPIPTPVPEPTPDPSVVPPSVPIPAKAGLPIQVVLDQVTQDSAKSTYGTISLYGWYLDPVGIQKVEIYIDDVYHGLANMGGSREDVYQAFPDYNNHVAGYYASHIEITTPGAPHKKENNKGKKVSVPGQFNHGVVLWITNKNNVVTKVGKSLTVDLN